MSDDFPFDPYHRPTDRVSVVEERIVVAAFMAVVPSSLSTTVGGRAVPFTLGEPVLVAENDQSSVLLVTVVTDNRAQMTGRFGGHRESLVPGSSISFQDNIVVQILLPKEKLWLVVNTVFLARNLVVSEVTP